MIYTPESQHEEDVVLRRRLHTIWLHEQDGEQQINIARGIIYLTPETG